jgi:hypothetical protein
MDASLCQHPRSNLEMGRRLLHAARHHILRTRLGYAEARRLDLLRQREVEDMYNVLVLLYSGFFFNAQTRRDEDCSSGLTRHLCFAFSK